MRSSNLFDGVQYIWRNQDMATAAAVEEVESPTRRRQRRRSTSPSSPPSSPTSSPRSRERSFPLAVRKQCWEKAEKVSGRDTERWRKDAAGNTVFKPLVACSGCLCYNYDHITPWSLGGASTLDNCQVLQVDDFRRLLAGRDMDAIELAAYGNVKRSRDGPSGCFLS
eukprot:jgi/Chlat1/6219/Chrsp44S05818